MRLAIVKNGPIGLLFSLMTSTKNRHHLMAAVKELRLHHRPLPWRYGLVIALQIA